MRSIIIGHDDVSGKLRQKLLKAKPDGQRGREEGFRGRICVEERERSSFPYILYELEFSTAPFNLPFLTS